ncbi:MAG: 3-hydroxylacyl-ACP dehydratase [Spirochaetaceae bacterium]|nr:3-hydroxylacyl-ACP dehydratase [Spirochaetaceae bacterium]
MLSQRIEHDELINLLPHKGKMFLLSRVISYDIKSYSITTEYDIKKECIFYEPENDGVPCWVAFELMAQSISAMSGIAHHIRGDSPLPGVILSVVGFDSSVSYFKNNTTVRISVSQDFMDEATRVSRYICRLYTSPDDETPSVTANLSVMEVQNVSAFFAEN